MLNRGDLVGPYEIRGFLGQGGMGRVYEAFDLRLERTVALKVIVAPSLPSSPDSERQNASFSARLLREARAVASLSHPNVVGIYDVGESGEHLYLAMEFVVGATLRSLMATTDVPLARKVRWLTDIARALDAAHAAGLVHRDVKPENVMIREDGAVKVLDFGIARRTIASSGEGALSELESITGSGAIAGTPVYMAPEQIKGHDVDARCDQFAWGVVAYELFAGARPWSDNGDVLQLVARVLTEPAPRLSTRVENLPSAIDNVVARALAKEPNERFRSMAEAADAIEPFAMPSTGSPRVRILPDARLASDHPSAFAATTRIPTSRSGAPTPSTLTVDPEVQRGASTPPSKDTTTPKRSAMRLAVPLALLGALAVTVSVVRQGRAQKQLPKVSATTFTDKPRSLSTVPEAEREYLNAVRQWHDGESRKAQATLRRSLTLDPTFAAAYLELALQTMKDDPAAAQAAFQSAFEHRHRLLPRESTLLEACEPYVRPQPDLDEWETRLTASIFRFPRDAEFQFLLGRARELQGDDKAATSAQEAAARIDSAFVPALTALAEAAGHVGHLREALEITARCLEHSPVASACLEVRYRLFAEAGDCHRAREEASQWRTVDTLSPLASAAFARSLYADGAPRPSVEEALSRSWELYSAAQRPTAEHWDRTYLALIDGDLATADQWAAELESDLGPTADQSDHAEIALLRSRILTESNDVLGAAKVARGFLERRDAWVPRPLAPDLSVSFYESLYRAGAIGKAEFAQRQTGALEGEALTTEATWAGVAQLVESKEEAILALAQRPSARAPISPVMLRRTLPIDFATGKIYALTGRAVEARDALLRVTGSCSSFQNALTIAHATYYLGLAYEASGSTDEAKAAYRKLADANQKVPKSRTARWATLRLEALSREVPR